MLLLLFASFVAFAFASSGGPPAELVSEDSKAVQRLEIQAPTMTEEDQYGYVMPDRYRCDSCRAVVYHLNQALTKRQPKRRRLQEWEYTELFEDTCKHGFKGYGIKLSNGQNVLSGPALTNNIDPLQPGMGAIQMGGESWEKRLGEICNKFVSDAIGEDELYARFRADGSLSQNLCFETKQCHMGPQTPAPVRRSERTRKMEKKVKKAEKKTFDAATFLKKLAEEHGLPHDAYTKKRSWDEWQQTMIQAAKRMADKSTKAANREQIVDV